MTYRTFDGTSQTESIAAGRFSSSKRGVSDGSATHGAIYFSDDVDTGIYSPANNQIALTTGGTQRLLIDASGNATFAGTIGGSVLASAMPAGSIIQVVTASTSTEKNVTTVAYVDSGLTASITPISTDSKILIHVSQFYRMTRSEVSAIGGIRLVRASTVIEEGPNNASGEEPFAIGGYATGNGASETAFYGRYNITYVDSPSSVSSLAYKTQQAVKVASDSAKMRTQYNSTSGEDGTSYITLMEIKG